MRKFINIPLDEDHRLESDQHSFFISRKRVVKGVVEWRGVSWHMSLEHAIKSYRTRCIRECGAQTFNELLDAINRIDRHLDASFHITGERTVKRAAEAVERAVSLGGQGEQELCSHPRQTRPDPPSERAPL
jgi:hypothetical protein